MLQNTKNVLQFLNDLSVVHYGRRRPCFLKPCTTGS